VASQQTRQFGRDVVEQKTGKVVGGRADQPLRGGVGEQNAAVNDLAAKAARARQAGRQALAVATMAAEQQAGEIEALRVALAAPTPAGETCVQVWELIRAGKL